MISLIYIKMCDGLEEDEENNFTEINFDIFCAIKNNSSWFHYFKFLLDNMLSIAVQIMTNEFIIFPTEQRSDLNSLKKQNEGKPI